VISDVTALDKDYIDARDKTRYIGSLYKIQYRTWDTRIFDKCIYYREEAQYKMKWPGKVFHLVNSNEWMCNICGMVANTGRGALLRRSFQDKHIVAVCALGMRAALPAEKEKASAMAHNIGLSCLRHLLAS